ncbi:hypothetical protein VNO78_28590 [Psophocarpus tetragonolobus]|uniref:PCI domain-containing protein n=1 Tax=Psophocarpus tetragonolobus TaxID=3891 RepID=A0AAN9RTI6_PSOTE
MRKEYALGKQCAKGHRSWKLVLPIQKKLVKLLVACALRCKLTAAVLSCFVDYVLAPASEPHAMLSSYLPNSKESDRDMEEVEFRRYIILTGDLAEIRWKRFLICYFLTTFVISYKIRLRGLVLRLLVLKHIQTNSAACGFQIQRKKCVVIVHLSLGEMPERNIFMQRGMEKALRPYFELTNLFPEAPYGMLLKVVMAVKIMKSFKQMLSGLLRHDVISTVLCNISISYSSIWLADLAKKLRLNSASPVADAESIVAKTIYDGAIDASLDHANGWMVSKETGDIYSTNEPQLAFNSRIALSPNMHNEAVQALHFPPNTSKEKESAEKRRERQQQEQKLAKTSNYDLLFILSYQLLAASLYFPLLLIFFYWNHYHFFFEA